MIEQSRVEQTGRADNEYMDKSMNTYYIYIYSQFLVLGPSNGGTLVPYRRPDVWGYSCLPKNMVALVGKYFQFRFLK